MAKIRIILADDHVLMREGLQAILERETDIEIVGHAKDGREAVDLVEKLKPDCVIMDIAMPNLNGLEATRLIRKLAPSVRIIVLSMHDAAEYVLQALKAGVHGYLLKQGIKDELILAIRSAYRGDKFLTSRISSSVIEGFLSQAEASESISPLQQLTQREREILQLIAEGNSSHQIADKLTISSKTVDRHRANIMEKLDIHNVAGLVHFAIQNGLVDVGD